MWSEVTVPTAATPEQGKLLCTTPPAQSAPHMLETTWSSSTHDTRMSFKSLEIPHKANIHEFTQQMSIPGEAERSAQGFTALDGETTAKMAQL